jgi:DNA-directed RNA polymerase II subunit RPB11
MPIGSRKLTYTADTKLPNAGEFVLMREDHTLGNMLRMELHNDRDVVFAGYQHPHPTDHRIIIKVHTNANSTPVRAMKEATHRLEQQIMSLQQQWESELESVRDSGAI